MTVGELIELLTEHSGPEDGVFVTDLGYSDPEHRFEIEGIEVTEAGVLLRIGNRVPTRGRSTGTVHKLDHDRAATQVYELESRITDGREVYRIVAASAQAARDLFEEGDIQAFKPTLVEVLDSDVVSVKEVTEDVLGD